MALPTMGLWLSLIFETYDWPLLKQVSFFEAARAVEKSGTRLKRSHHNQVRLVQIHKKIRKMYVTWQTYAKTSGNAALICKFLKFLINFWVSELGLRSYCIVVLSRLKLKSTLRHSLLICYKNRSEYIAIIGSSKRIWLEMFDCLTFDLY